jgi:hypothetical protein
MESKMAAEGVSQVMLSVIRLEKEILTMVIRQRGKPLK